MRKFVFIICLGLLQIIVDACCQLDPPPFGYVITIDLLNKNTGRTLVASRDSLYYPDSIVLETGNRIRRYNMAVNRKDTILRSTYIYPESLNFDTLYFHYLTTKVDTIVIYYHKETKKACGEKVSLLKKDKTELNGRTVCEPCNEPREIFVIRK